MGNICDNHIDRKNHIANAYFKDIYAKVLRYEPYQPIGHDGVQITHTPM